jgi:hypothetical protein
MKKIMSVMTVAATAFALSASAQVNFSNGAGGLWSDPANWDTGVVPVNTDTVNHGWSASTITIDGVAQAATILSGHTNANNTISVVGGGNLFTAGLEIGNMGAAPTGATGTLAVNGGSVTVFGTSNFGLWAGAGGRTSYLTLNSGSFTASGDTYFGGWNDNAYGVGEINGGTYTQNSGVMYIGRAADGQMTVNGGVLDLTSASAGWDPLRVGDLSGGGGLLVQNGGHIITKGTQINFDTPWAMNATVELNGGLFEIDNPDGTDASHFRIGWGGVVDFGDDGVFVMHDGDWTGLLDGYVDSGNITWSSAGTDMYSATWDAAYGSPGNGILYVDYDEGTNTTSAWAVIPEPSTISLLAVAGCALVGFRRIKS